MHISNHVSIENGLLGGLILGTSAASFMLLAGRITGLSGIIKGTVRPEGEPWHYTYSLGLITAGTLAKVFYPSGVENTSDRYPTIPIVIISGLLVGYGTRLSSGCTSGHGLCGLARLSPRSFASVMTFMATGMVTASIARLPEVEAILTTTQAPALPIDSILVALVPSAIALGASYVYNHDIREKEADVPHHATTVKMHTISLVAATVFGIGLAVSGMCNPEKVRSFLDFSGFRGWDYTLVGVMGGGVLVNAIAFPFLKASDVTTMTCEQPVSSKIKLGLVPENMVIDAKLIIGSVLFGIGWGLGGICPGPAMVSLGAGSPIAATFVPAMLLGMMMRSDKLW